ncbi:MAG: tetraacyldisaccharide 4'-kinase [Vicingaceae bacterium]
MSFFIRILLLPASLIYWLVTKLRNFAYDTGIFSSRSYNFPLICVGNLSVGGTGKTPHTEFIIKHLKEDCQIATLSRGYGRKTKGFILADSSDSAESIGDEPFQLFKKFEDIMVAVDEKRRRGIQKLRSLPSPPGVIVLDDAYQHRSVKAGLSILLTDYSKLYINDYILPSGRLRESRSAAKRADVIVVTKSPAVLSPLEIRRITSTLNPQPYQKVFFSYLSYRKLKPLNNAAVELNLKKKHLSNWGVILTTAIANPEPLFLYLKRYAKEVEKLSFKDHHFFTEKDYEKIVKRKEGLLSPKKLVITTEKDAVKLDLSQLEDIAVFCLPIEIKFHKHGDDDFAEELNQYVRSYTGEL